MFLGNAEKSKTGPYSLFDRLISARLGNTSSPDRLAIWVPDRSSEVVLFTLSSCTSLPSALKVYPFCCKIVLSSVFVTSTPFQSMLLSLVHEVKHIPETAINVLIYV